MKRILILALAVSMFIGCKKGENDPGISFRSRDSRITGEWKITSFEQITESTTNSKLTKTVVKYDGKLITTTVTKDNETEDPDISDNSYEGTLTITKDGTITYVEVTKLNNVPANSKTSNGTWAWGNSKKNKSQIVFTNANGALLKHSSFVIDELRNKKLVLKNEDFSETIAGTNVSSTKNSFTVELEQ